MVEHLHNAHCVKNDEYYTTPVVVEKELFSILEHDAESLERKTILCPCDDPDYSNYIRELSIHFDETGANEVIASCFNADGNGKVVHITEQDRDVFNLPWSYHDGDGSFDSPEVEELRDRADFVFTNPPFSRWRDFVQWCLDGGCGFSVVSPDISTSYKITCRVMSEGIATNSHSFKPGSFPFRTFHYPDAPYADDGYQYTKISCYHLSTVKRPARYWPSNSMDHNIKNHKKVSAGYEYLDGIPSDVNYIDEVPLEVPRSELIPNDFAGVMSVPSTYMLRYDPDSVELLGAPTSGARLHDRYLFKRYLIRNKHPHKEETSGSST